MACLTEGLSQGKASSSGMPGEVEVPVHGTCAGPADDREGFATVLRHDEVVEHLVCVCRDPAGLTAVITGSILRKAVNEFRDQFAAKVAEHGPLLSPFEKTFDLAPGIVLGLRLAPALSRVGHRVAPNVLSVCVAGVLGIDEQMILIGWVMDAWMGQPHGTATALEEIECADPNLGGQP